MRIIDADALFDSLIFPNDQWGKTFKELLDDEPTVNLNKCFEGMTNGEVMQTLFPKCEIDIDDDGWFITNIDGCSAFTPGWWNAPYQKGGE